MVAEEYLGLLQLENIIVNSVKSRRRAGRWCIVSDSINASTNCDDGNNDQYLRRSAGGGASLWSRSRSSSLPVDIAGGGGRRGDLSSVQGSGLGKLLT